MYTITLQAIEHVDVILKGLGKLPAEESYTIINTIREQVTPQFQAKKQEESVAEAA